MLEIYSGFSTYEQWKNDENMKYIFDYEECGVYVQPDGWKDLSDWSWVDYCGESVLVIEHFDPANAVIPWKKLKNLLELDASQFKWDGEVSPKWTTVVILMKQQSVEYTNLYGDLQVRDPSWLWWGRENYVLFTDGWIVDVWVLNSENKLVKLWVWKDEIRGYEHGQKTRECLSQKWKSAFGLIKEEPIDDQ